MATHSDDLDELLDSALDDLQHLNLKPSKSNDDKSEEKGREIEGALTVPPNVQGLGLGLPELGSKKKKKATKQRKEAASSDNAYVFETLDKLRQQTREAFKGLEETSGGPTGSGGLGEGGDLNPEMLEEWVKQFEELAGPKDMESLVETMMQQLLSKEILHEPLKEISERYPKWLEDHKEKLSEEDYGRYSQQHQMMVELIDVYESEPGNFTKIMELMQKMQECGQPPNDIVQELSPDIDFSQLGQMTGEQNCCIM